MKNIKESKVLFTDAVKLDKFPEEVQATVTLLHDKDGGEYYAIEVDGEREYLLYQESASGSFGCEECGTFTEECQRLGEWVQKHLIS